MVKTLETQVLAELRRPRVKKKRVTFILTEATKEGLANWCADKGVKESPALEQMIRAVVPARYFDRGET